MTLSQLKGKVVMLDFWASWCEPCRLSIPHLIELYKAEHANGLELIGMNLEQGREDVVREFVLSNHISYPIVITSDEVKQSYQITGVPTLFLIDKKGILRNKYIGFSPNLVQEIQRQIASLLSEP